MPNRRNRGRGRGNRLQNRRFRGSRVPPVSAGFFQTTLTGVQIPIKNSGNITVSFTAANLAPELQVANQFRPIRLLRVIARFYPVPTPADKPVLLSAQLLLPDLATNTNVPVCPIRPLSSTFITTFRGRSPRPTYIMSNAGTGEAQLLVVITSNVATAPNVLLDLEIHWQISRDPIYSQAVPPLLVNGQLYHPDADDDLLSQCSILSA